MTHVVRTSRCLLVGTGCRVPGAMTSRAPKVAGCKKSVAQIMGEVGKEKFPKGAERSAWRMGRRADCVDAASGEIEAQVAYGKCVEFIGLWFDVACGLIQQEGWGGVEVRAGSRNDDGSARTRIPGKGLNLRRLDDLLQSKAVHGHRALDERPEDRPEATTV